MNRTGALRCLLGTAAAILLAGSGPALASAAAGPSDVTNQRDAAGIGTTTTCSPGARACPIRIVFAAGAYSGQAHSQLSGIRSRKWFVVGAHAGQTMIVVVEGRGPTDGIVYFPNGQSDGQPGGRVFDGQVPVSGDYRIRVSESQMAEAWSGRVDVVVLIY
jgi:hypothetical protein